MVALDDVPQSSVRAPRPRTVADEHTCLVGFYLEIRDATREGDDVRDEPVAVVAFPRYCVMMFGPPNEVLDSSWIHQLERMNAVHPNHRRARYRELHHFILSFHDSTFECVAPRYEIT